VDVLLTRGPPSLMFNCIQESKVRPAFMAYALGEIWCWCKCLFKQAGTTLYSRNLRKRGQPACMSACQGGHMEIVRVLFHLGEDCLSA
jgi:hypothetical protein